MSTHSIVALIRLTTSLPPMAPPIPSSSTSTSLFSLSQRRERAVAVADGAHGHFGLLERRDRRLARGRVVVHEQHGLAPARAERPHRGDRHRRVDAAVVVAAGEPEGVVELRGRRLLGRGPFAQQRQDLVLRAPQRAHFLEHGRERDGGPRRRGSGGLARSG
jgi:hypothetical protein